MHPYRSKIRAEILGKKQAPGHHGISSVTHAQAQGGRAQVLTTLLWRNGGPSYSELVALVKHLGHTI